MRSSSREGVKSIISSIYFSLGRGRLVSTIRERGEVVKLILSSIYFSLWRVRLVSTIREGCQVNHIFKILLFRGRLLSTARSGGGATLSSIYYSLGREG